MFQNDLVSSLSPLVLYKKMLQVTSLKNSRVSRGPGGQDIQGEGMGLVRAFFFVSIAEVEKQERATLSSPFRRDILSSMRDESLGFINS